MKRKFLSIVLASAMTLVAMTGCGNPDVATDPADMEMAAPEESGAAAPEVAADSADAIQNLINNTSGTVDLTLWTSEEDQEFTQKVLEDFKSLYPDVSFNITLGAESESTVKDTVLSDVEAAADVYTFAHDQINDLVNAGALQEIAKTYTFDVASANIDTSVEAASLGGKLYAYPMTADNGYFMFYDSSVIKDPSSLENMIADAKAANKKIAIQFNNGWYLYSFFKAVGLDATLNDDGKTNSCNWDAEGGTDVCQTILDLVNTGVVVNMDDGTTVTGIQDGVVCAAVNGIWNAQVAAEAWGDSYEAAKLPTVKIGDKDCQLSSYSGFKLVGVNPHSKNVGWAMLLAEYLTSEAVQTARFQARNLGPSNINAAASPEVQSDKAIAALAAQAPYSTPQVIGGNFWAPAETLGQILASGNPDGTDLQKLLNTAVEGITAPVSE
ncbi:MAG: extracellular solute-binding protein [Butyrivibrio sp.]|nr:extracellular solute-binding protein [Butyrivibrio sp.]